MTDETCCPCGLSAALEKFIIDVEMLQMFAELMTPTPAGDDDIGFEAIAAAGPGGHFFAVEHTMARYRTAFYAPLLSDWSNFGRWSETGALTATQRATGLWKTALAEFTEPAMDAGAREALAEFVERRTSEGGAPPLS